MKIGILGAGNIAKTMAKAVNGVDEACAYAVASRDIEKAQSFAKENGFEKAYGSYEELVKDREVELIYIATPHSHHFEHAKLCIENGKHVLCEKAFTANAAQAKELFRLAKEKNIFITEAIWTRYMPSREIINELLESGMIGKVTSLTANLGYVIDHKQRITDPALAGGALLDIGIYPINFASMVFGDDIASVTSSVVKHQTGVDAIECICINYKDNKSAVLHSNIYAITDRQGVINGSKGYMVVENINNPECIKVYDLERKLILEKKRPSQINGYEYELISSINAIKEGKLECEEMPHSETVRIMELMDSLRLEWGVKYPFED